MGRKYANVADPCFFRASPIACKIRECLLRGHLPAVMEPAGEIYADLRSRFCARTFALNRAPLPPREIHGGR